MTTLNKSNDTHSSRSGIGTLTEKSLHVALIQFFAEPGDKLESNINGYIIDIVQDKTLIEIQIKNFSAVKTKVLTLCEDYQVRLIHPIARQKWIIKEDTNGEMISRRKSPKKGRVEEVFNEIIRIPKALSNPNFSIWVVMVDMNEIWVNDGKGSWRRKYWSIKDSQLLNVFEIREFNQPIDYVKMLPYSLPKIFTNKEVSTELGISKSLAGKMTYCLRKMNEIKIVGKRGREYLLSHA
jgi:hypothetical protein